MLKLTKDEASLLSKALFDLVDDTTNNDPEPTEKEQDDIGTWTRSIANDLRYFSSSNYDVVEIRVSGKDKD